MRIYAIIYAATALAVGVMNITCKGPNGPIDEVDVPPGHVLLSEGFEGDLSEYRQITYEMGQGMMSISTRHARFGKGSLTSDSNNTGLKKPLDLPLDDSIAGLQFYLKATKCSQSNLLVAIGKTGSSANGLFTIIGMGIGVSDSLQCVYEENPFDPTVKERRNIAPLTLNKWYKCRVEYDYNDTTLTYFVDDAMIYRRGAPSPMTLQIFFAMRDSLGAQGPSGYYVDNVSVYKR